MILTTINHGNFVCEAKSISKLDSITDDKTNAKAAHQKYGVYVWSRLGVDFIVCDVMFK